MKASFSYHSRIDSHIVCIYSFQVITNAITKLLQCYIPYLMGEKRKNSWKPCQGNNKKKRGGSLLWQWTSHNSKKNSSFQPKILSQKYSIHYTTSQGPRFVDQCISPLVTYFPTPRYLSYYCNLQVSLDLWQCSKFSGKVNQLYVFEKIHNPHFML